MFTRRSSAVDHFEAIHFQILNHECPYCIRLFTSSNQTRVHVHDHHRAEHQMAKANIK